MFFKRRTTNRLRARQPLHGNGLGTTPVFSYHARSTRSEQAGARRTSKLLWVAQPAKKPLLPRSAPRNVPKKFLGIVLAIIGVAVAVNSAMLSRDPEIIALADSAARRSLLHTEETYYQAARSILGGSLANSTKLTVDTGQVAEAIKKQFPELEEVSVALPLTGHTPLVYIQPAQPALLLKSAGDILVISDSGRVLAVSPSLTRLTKLGLTVVEDQSGLALRPGADALPGSDIAFITEVVGQLKAKKVAITALTLPAGASGLDVRLKDEPYIVKFNLRGEARAEVGTYLAVRSYLKRTRQTPASYIDVRVDNKAYYR